MFKPSIKIYIILSLILIAVVGAFLFLSSKNTKNQQPVLPNPTITPISGEIPDTTEVPITIVPTETGGLSGGFEPEEKEEAAQIQDLSYQVPLSEPQFDIDFNWDQYKFVVTLKEPKNQSQAAFNQWQQANYPAITEQYFIFN